MGFDLRSLDLSDLVRANKQGVNLDTKTAHVDDSEQHVVVVKNLWNII